VEDEYIEVLVLKRNGEEWLLEIDKDADEDLGIVFENGLMDEYKSCHNKCIFCFIDQMPKGMRDTLYFKDDDSRLSFLQGNYVTLTNMSDKDIRRIIKYNLGPINVSVHTTNKNLRCKMLNNRFAGEALDKLDILYDAGIEMNGQIVLCKGVNDGAELEKSISDLSKYIPVMRSVSVVPAGLTKFRDGLYPLDSFNKEDAEEVIDIIERYQKEFHKKYGIHFIHASDEWYIMAERDFPEEERYDEYVQLENGVGMMRLLWQEFTEEYSNIQHIPSTFSDNIEISIATGVLAYDMIKKMSTLLENKFNNIKIHCYKIINNYFGEKITVSGLITATDLIEQLQDKPLGERLLLPCNILRSGENVFLDDYTLEDVSEKLKVPIIITPSDGKGFINSVINGDGFKGDNSNFVYIKTYNNE
jgi:putative radical SAM enzyme (TIGR03279 family)